MSYNINLTKEDKKNLKKPKSVNSEILEVFRYYLNVDKELFHLKELANDDIFTTDSLLPKDAFANGTLQIRNVNIGQSLEDVIHKDALLTILLPLDDSTNIYINAIEKAILNLNRAAFKGTEDNMYFDEVTFTDSNRLPEAIDGVEYELVYIEAKIRCSASLLMTSDQSVIIDGEELGGVISIVYGTQKTTDGFVGVNPLQKNHTNGIQISLTIDVEINVKEETHQKLIRESDQDVTYNVRFNTGVSGINKEYRMLLAKFTMNGVIGDTVKAQYVFIVGD